MANNIKLKRSAVPGKAPQTGDLDLGELALNTYDGKAYIKKSADGVESIVEVGSNAQPELLTASQVITMDTVIESGRNALSIETVEVEDGIEVTIPDGSSWVVIS